MEKLTRFEAVGLVEELCRKTTLLRYAIAGAVNVGGSDEELHSLELLAGDIERDLKRALVAL
jgi:hypothetical protein